MLSDELLTRIRTGSGRVYSHEAKDMAAELLDLRLKTAAAVGSKYCPSCSTYLRLFPGKQPVFCPHCGTKYP